MANRKKPRPRRKGEFKKFSVAFLSSGAGPSKEVLQEYQARGATLKDKYTVPIPPTKFRKTDTEGANIAPKVEVDRRLVEILKDIPSERYIAVAGNHRWNLRLYFEFGAGRFFFVYVDKLCVKQSIVYPNKDFALAQYELGKVRWALIEETVSSRPR